MHVLTPFDAVYVYLGLAITLYIACYHDLPATESMKRSETLKFLLTSPLIFFLFVAASPVIAGMFVRVVWIWWRDTCAFKRISEKADKEDEQKGSDRL